MKSAWTNYCKGKVIHSRTNNIEKDTPEIIKCYKEANNWPAIRGKTNFTGLENSTFNYFRNEIEKIEGLKEKSGEKQASYERMLKSALKDGR